jgi:hypothetical protein
VSRVKQAVARHDGLVQVAIVLAAVTVYELLRRAIRPDWPAALAHARDVSSWEAAVDLRWEAPLQQAFLGAPGLVRALNLFYLVGHFALTALFFSWLYRRSRVGFRLFRDGFLLATALALAAHWAFPTAPPRLAGLGLEDTLRTLSGIDIGSQASSAFSNPVAAVPSLHVGWAFGVGAGLVLYARSVWWRVAGAVYPLVVTLTVIVTGNHFVLDAVGGVAVMTAGLMLVKFCHVAGWSSQVARRAHNPEVAGSNPAPAISRRPRTRGLPFGHVSRSPTGLCPIHALKDSRGTQRHPPGPRRGCRRGVRRGGCGRPVWSASCSSLEVSAAARRPM